jgi:formate dehydrogenase major subunit
MFYPDYADVKSEPVHKKFEDLWKTELSTKPGLTVVEIINAANKGEIKGMYIHGENPAMSDPDLDHARAGIAKLEHLVVQDIFLTETAMMADVILPASAWPEKTGTVTNTNRQVQMGRKALDVPGDTRDDMLIIIEIAKRLGLDWTYKHPSEVFAEMKLAMPSLDNITWDRSSIRALRRIMPARRWCSATASPPRPGVPRSSRRKCSHPPKCPTQNTRWC